MNEKKALITGSCGLIGAQAVKFLVDKDFQVVGIDNDMRAYFFGAQASTLGVRSELESLFKDKYLHCSIDIRDKEALAELFGKHKFQLIIHTAAQPSHDWAARQPYTDFEINANGTLNLLESFRQFCPEAVFIFTSTNKVYGDRPNSLPFIESGTRWDLPKEHPFYNGIDETMSIDDSTHSLFGVSKAAADLLVQEYGRYFKLKTVSFRGGCLTGPLHKGAELHGFLAYLAKCVADEKPYKIYGYKGKQVRDNIHSFDMVNAFWQFYQNPKKGAVYNIGGSRFSNISMKEAIDYFEKALNKKAQIEHSDKNRIGDHIWYISNVNKFKTDYPNWDYKYNIHKIMDEICASQ